MKQYKMSHSSVLAIALDIGHVLEHNSMRIAKAKQVEEWCISEAQKRGVKFDQAQRAIAFLAMNNVRPILSEWGYDNAIYQAVEGESQTSQIHIFDIVRKLFFIRK